jgi:hypothetical protein
MRTKSVLDLSHSSHGTLFTRFYCGINKVISRTIARHPNSEEKL